MTAPTYVYHASVQLVTPANPVDCHYTDVFLTWRTIHEDGIETEKVETTHVGVYDHMDRTFQVHFASPVPSHALMEMMSQADRISNIIARKLAEKK